MWTITTSVFWTGLGAYLIKYNFIPIKLSGLLGRSLYWVGVPLQILVLARKSNFSPSIWLPPLITVVVLLLGLGLANLSLHFLKQAKSIYQVGTQYRSSQGSFVLASILGNTGFVGLAIAPAFVDQGYLAWIVLYGVTHNLLGSYGLGVFLASYFGRSQQGNCWWIQLRDLLSVPSLWAFAIGWGSRSIQLPVLIEEALETGVLFVIPAAFLYIGMQLCQLQGVRSLQSAIVPTALKMVVLPGLAGLGLTLLNLSGDARLALVLMSGMPSAFANLILAEEYNLDRQVAASSIVLSTVLLPLMIPLWLVLFG